MSLTHRLVFSAMLFNEIRFTFLAQKAGSNRHRTAGIEDVNNRLAVMRRNLNGSVRPARSRSTDQQWNLEAIALHFPRHMYHLIERRCDQAAEPDHVGIL